MRLLLARSVPFDACRFLGQLAQAYDSRDPGRLRALLALEDPRFAVFEGCSGELFDGDTYAAILDTPAEGGGRMSFELLRCERYGEHAVLHAIQRIVGGEGGREVSETVSRATMWVAAYGETPRVYAAHFTAVSDGEPSGAPPSSSTR